MQGGITIRKHCNHLQGDIVEVFQCVKCAIHKDLLFHEPGPSSIDEYEEYENEADPNERASGDDEGEEDWDEFFSEMGRIR